MKAKAAFFVFSTLIVFDLYHSKRIAAENIIEEYI